MTLFKSRRASLLRTTFDLSNPLVTSHLDPGITRDPKPLAFSINPLEQGEWKVDIHALFGAMVPGEIRGNVFPHFQHGPRFPQLLFFPEERG
jgi:hypothetical protein